MVVVLKDEVIYDVGKIPGISIHQEMELLSEPGISNLEVITIAAYNGTKALRIEKSNGSIEKGKIADIVRAYSKSIIGSIKRVKQVLDSNGCKVFG